MNDVVFYHEPTVNTLTDHNQQPLPPGWYYRLGNLSVGPFQFPTEANLDYEETVRD